MSLRRYSLWLGFLFFWALLLVAGNSLSWANSKVAVLYPAVKEPYFSVFQNILRGIESSLGPAARPYALPESFDSRQLNDWLQREQIDSIIALGKQGLQAAQSLGEKRPVVIGALPVAPGGFSGISLSPDPSILFRHLKELVPNVKRVHVVFSDSNAWLIKRAESSARSYGLRFSAYPVNDLREAVHQYRNLLQSIRGPSEAIWLPLDNTTASDDVILPLVLQAAWEKNIVVFSSKPPHAQRGALFSFYPDHFGMGQSLGRMASVNTSLSPGIIPLADLQLAVNLRTAFHLGLRFTTRQQEGFDLIFPSP